MVKKRSFAAGYPNPDCKNGMPGRPLKVWKDPLKLKSRLGINGQRIKHSSDEAQYFTDNSPIARTGLSGVGVYRKDKDRGEAFSLRSTVFQAEIFVILEVASREGVKMATRRKFATTQIAKQF